MVTLCDIIISCDDKYCMCDIIMTSSNVPSDANFSFIKGGPRQNCQLVPGHQTKQMYQCDKRFFPRCQHHAQLQIQISNCCYLTQLCGWHIGSWCHYALKAHRTYLLHCPSMPDSILIDLTLLCWCISTHLQESLRTNGWSDIS